MVAMLRPRLLAAALAALAALTLAACSGGTYSPPVPRSVAESSYVIGPGDSLSVFVYQSPQLSLPDVSVRPDGRVSLPLIPDIVAAGKTPTQFASDIEARLKKYVNEPNVSVIMRGFVGPSDRQVRVIGEATDPAAIPYREGMSLLDVMIATKGLTRYAAGNRAVIVRKVNGGQQTIHVHLSDLIKDGDVEQNVPMAPGDTLIIPETYF